MSMVATSSTLIETEIRLTSRLPSPLGEKNVVIVPTLITGGSLLSRWATKKAANVAPTRITKVILATSVIAPLEASAGGLVLANDRDHVPLPAAGDAAGFALDVLGELSDAIDAEHLGNRLGGGLVAAGVH